MKKNQLDEKESTPYGKRIRHCGKWILPQPGIDILLAGCLRK
jgi:hypothetical protein